MEIRDFGNTGLKCSALGLGAGNIGADSQSEDSVARLLNEALDFGITLIDTARGYGLSEERIGMHIAHRRHEYVLSTKVGYGVPGMADWTYDCVIAGVEMALQKMRTDVLDIVHLHSCPIDVLQRGEVIDALQRTVVQGKVRVAAYSGENSELAWALDSGRFASLECSVNLFDQNSLTAVLPTAAARGLGVIAKRPLGNAPWRFKERPVGDYSVIYWERMKRLAYDIGNAQWSETALRFAAFAPGVSCAIVGTASVENLRRNVDAANRGGLERGAQQEFCRLFAEVQVNWSGQI